MNNLKIFITKIKKENYLLSSNLLANSLIFLIFITCLITDYLVTKSHLSLILIGAIVSATVLTRWGTKKFRKIKLSQIIRDEGPAIHKKKSGTPNMGGIIIIPLGLIIGNIVSFNSGINKELFCLTFLGIGFMLIGAIDDWTSFTLKQNKGLSAQGKLLLQLMVGTIFLAMCSINNLIDDKVYIFNNEYIELNYLIWPIALFILLAESNATNLTDGLDGLASGCGAIIFTGLSIELSIRGNFQDFPMASLCIAMAGTWLGFLLNNKKPAKIFMGDTGSLAMGAVLAGISLISNTLWGLFIMGIIFLAESLSVIVQVLFFKLSKKVTGKGHRIFKMAPLHHHYELNGQEEVAIVRNFWLLSIIFVFIRLLLF